MKTDKSPKKDKEAPVTIGVTRVDPDRPSHPLATGVGAATGAVAGAVAGSLAGPIGTIAGSVVGVVIGGMAGAGAAEVLDPTVAEAHWRKPLRVTPSDHVKSYSYEDYGPACRLGWQSHGRHVGRSFEHAESDLSREWDGAKGSSCLGWGDAHAAVRAGWQRISDTVGRLTPGDSDHDGR